MTSKTVSPRVNRMLTILEPLFRPVDIALLAVFRMAFGLLMGYEATVYWGKGWYTSNFTDAPVLLKYWGFDWVQTLPPPWMDVVNGILFLMCICIALGLFYRVSMVLFFVIFVYLFVQEAEYYLNHFYLISTLGFMMMFLPLNRKWSLDVVLNPALKSETVPAWTLWILQFMLTLVYVSAALVKMNGDWLFRAEPMRHWLQGENLPFLSEYVLETEWGPYVISWCGMLLDLLIAPALLFPPTRWIAMGCGAVFHLLNSQIFNIGIFPWFMLAANFLYCSSSFPRKVMRKLPYLKRFAGEEPDPWGGELYDLMAKPASELPRVPEALERYSGFWTRGRLLTVVMLMNFVVFEIAMPLRYLAFPGFVDWTGYGHRFSWRMMLTSKEAVCEFYWVRDKVWYRIPTEQFLEKAKQDTLCRDPGQMLQFAHAFDKKLQSQGYPDPDIRVLAWKNVNYRNYYQFTDPRYDLTELPWHLGPHPFVVEYDPNDESKNTPPGGVESPERKDLVGGLVIIPVEPLPKFWNIPATEKHAQGGQSTTGAQ